jgi:bifunctional non-homologous end joining protein LigD
MILERLACPFAHGLDIEVKHDGFRGMAYIEAGEARLVSRRDHDYKSFPSLCEAIATELNVSNAILDGEIVSVDHNGIAQFKQLMHRRLEPRYYAFDILWWMVRTCEACL